MNSHRCVPMAAVLVFSFTAEASAQTTNPPPPWVRVLEGQEIPSEMAIDESLARLQAMDRRSAGNAERVLVNSARMSEAGAKAVVEFARNSDYARSREEQDAMRSRCVRASEIRTEGDLLAEILAFDNQRQQRWEAQEVSLAERLSDSDHQRFMGHVTERGVSGFMAVTDWQVLFQLREIDITEYMAETCSAYAPLTPTSIQMPGSRFGQPR